MQQPKPPHRPRRPSPLAGQPDRHARKPKPPPQRPGRRSKRNRPASPLLGRAKKLHGSDSDRGNDERRGHGHAVGLHRADRGRDVSGNRSHRGATGHTQRPQRAVLQFFKKSHLNFSFGTVRNCTGKPCAQGDPLKSHLLIGSLQIAWRMNLTAATPTAATTNAVATIKASVRIVLSASLISEGTAATAEPATPSGPMQATVARLNISLLLKAVRNCTGFRGDGSFRGGFRGSAGQGASQDFLGYHAHRDAAVHGGLLNPPE